MTRRSASAGLLVGLFFLLVPFAAQASSLTSAQIQSIINLLQVFGADSATIANVQSALTGGVSSPSLPCVNFSRTLAPGMSGSDIEALQQLLGVTPATGYFGSITAHAVMQWQSTHGLAEVGIVGPLTRAAMACHPTIASAGSAPSSSNTQPTLPISAPIQPPTSQPPLQSARSQSIAPSITISGNHLLANGQPFQVKGLDIDSLPYYAPLQGNECQKYAPSPFYQICLNALQNVAGSQSGTTNILAAAKRWDANTIRIWIFEKYLDPQNSSVSVADRNGYLNTINSTLQQVEQNGFAVILQMGGDTGVPTATTTRAWQAVLPIVGADKAVMLALYNEPSPNVGWAVWQGGGFIIDAAGDHVQNIGMQPLINQLRQAGAQNVLIVPTLDQKYLNLAYAIADPLGQLAYGLHPRPFLFSNDTDIYGLATGSAFSTSTNKAILDAAFGNAASQVPVIADEWDILEFSGAKLSCTDVPQIAYFEAAYLQKFTAGMVGYGLDNVPLTIAGDWQQYNPRGFADPLACTNANSIWNNIGDVGGLLYAAYQGSDLWGSWRPLSFNSVTPSSAPIGSTVALTLTGSGFDPIGDDVYYDWGTGQWHLLWHSTSMDGSTIALPPFSLTNNLVTTFSIVVHDSQGTSSPRTFTTTPAPSGLPTISSMTPPTAPVGSTVNLVITGSNFDSGNNTVEYSWPGSTWHVLTVASSTQSGTQITLPPLVLSNATPQTYQVIVANHVGVSNAVSFTTTSP